nr:MAG TPA: E3 ubiquitin-protein ligase [Caudoviricetes sp.]DAQ95624.1 MAG TPA: E3 ubiquitin-protein ligase [Caudoviricetes sp.]
MQPTEVYFVSVFGLTVNNVSVIIRLWVEFVSVIAEGWW